MIIYKLFFPGNLFEYNLLTPKKSFSLCTITVIEIAFIKIYVHENIFTLESRKKYLLRNTFLCLNAIDTRPRRSLRRCNYSNIVKLMQSMIR
jgi:hypothetical protein